MTENNMDMPCGRGRKRGRKENAKKSRIILIIAGLLAILFAVLALTFLLKLEKPEAAGEATVTDSIAEEIKDIGKPGENEGIHENAESEISEELEIHEESEISEESDDGSFDISAEVLETASGEAEESAIELIFAGDIYLSEFVLNAYDKAGGIEGVLCDEYRREIADCDMFIANEEFPFSARGEKAPDKQFTFRLPPERVNILKEMNVDLVSLANNHSLDFGETALLDTVDTLDAAGIKHFGAGKNKAAAREPVFVEIKGKRIGFIAASRVIPVSSWAAGKDKPGLFICYDPTELIADVKKMEEECDYTIVFLHWGTERKTVPDSYMEQMARELVKSGADAVIGSHPHVLQPIEIIDSKPVVYSLGNFVFGSKIESTMLFKLILDGESISYELLPGKAAMGYTYMLPEDKRAEFIEHFPVSESSIQ